MKLHKEFWQGKRVLLTGHTGFKGSWLTLWLQQLGAKVTGIALPPQAEPNLFTHLHLSHSLATNQQLSSHYCDIRDATTLTSIVQKSEPEIVFHLAAQPLVRTSYYDPLTTFATNVMGTANLLNALRNATSLRVVVAVTTDKVYRNLEQPYPYREDDPLGGHDPYSASKAASEIVVGCFRDAFLIKQKVAVATARAGNVIGGGDWSVDRLIPDAVRAWETCNPLYIRRPQAIRPWQHVLEPLAGYLMLAQKLWENPNLAGAYNFGPETSEITTVREVVELARSAYGGGEVIWGDGNEGPHETEFLALEIAKARTLLGFVPCLKLAESIKRTIKWYCRFASGEEAYTLCFEDINMYSAPQNPHQ